MLLWMSQLSLSSKIYLLFFFGEQSLRSSHKTSTFSKLPITEAYLHAATAS